MTSNRTILFYSKRCSHCSQFIQELYKSGIFNQIEKLCIEEIKVPKGINSVPTLIVPQYQRPLVGNECFAWIQEQEQINQEKTKPKQNQKPTQTQSLPGFEDILPFSDTMGGFSDSYSYLNDERPMERTFSFLTQTQSQSNAIQTPEDINNQSTDKQDSMARALEQLKEARSREL